MTFDEWWAKQDLRDYEAAREAWDAMWSFCQPTVLGQQAEIDKLRNENARLLEAAHCVGEADRAIERPFPTRDNRILYGAIDGLAAALQDTTGDDE
jgi:hypothetical protein